MTDADNVVRGFVREKATGLIYAVERIANSKQVIAALQIAPGVVCRHQLDALDIPTLPDRDDAIEFKFAGDYEPFDAPCNDATHLLSEIGQQEKVCKALEADYNDKRSKAKDAKDKLDEAVDRLRELISNATAPKELPLLDKAS